MKDYGASRVKIFEETEKGALNPLPPFPFVVARWKYARVSLDYHIQVEHHFYSVPYTHVKKEVLVKITEHLIEVFLNNERIASHPRSSVRYRFSTLDAHMPPQHRAVKSWTAENFLSWAKSVGSATTTLIERILTSPRYKEQSYRSILGIQRLEGKYGRELLEKGAASALERRQHRQRALAQILEILATQNESLSPEESNSLVVLHENIRGETYYH